MLIQRELMKIGCFVRCSMREKVEVVCAVKLVQKISAKEDYVFLVCFPVHQMIISLKFKKFKTT